MYIAEILLAQGTAINPGHLDEEFDVNTKRADDTPTSVNSAEHAGERSPGILPSSHHPDFREKLA